MKSKQKLRHINDVVSAFVREMNARDRKKWNKYDNNVHQALFDGQQQYPTELGDFHFEQPLRGNTRKPYSPHLESQFAVFEAEGVLRTKFGEYEIIDISKLPESTIRIREVAKYICDRLV